VTQEVQIVTIFPATLLVGGGNNVQAVTLVFK